MQKNIFLELQKKETIFLNRNVLMPDYLPETLLFRESEIREIAESLMPALSSQRAGNLFIYGKTGTGKTSTVKHVLKQLEEVGKKITALYINCRNYNSKYKVITKILKEFYPEKDFVGYSATFVFEKMLEFIEEKEIQAIICLDEIDKVKDLDELVYSLVRANDELKKGCINLIGISNRLIFKDRLDPRTKSSLLEKEMIFKPYNAFELKEILRERAIKGLNENSLSEAALALIAAISAQRTGDARTALMLLLRSAELAENEGLKIISEREVMKAKDKIEEEIIFSMISSLPEQQQAVLLSIAMLTERKKGMQKLNEDERILFSGEIYDAYKSIAKELKYSCVSMRWFREYLNELELYGLITSTSSGKGIRGQTRLIRLGFNAEKIRKVIEKELGLKEN